MRKVIFLSTLFIYALGNAAHCASLYDTVKKGNQLYWDGKFNEALKTYVDGQIEHADELALKYNIASSHYKTKNYDEAVKGYLDVAASAKDIPLQEKSLYNCGNAMYQQGRLEEAIEYYKKALELDRNDLDAKHNLEFVQEELKKRKDEAKETAQKQQQKQQQQKQQQDQQDQQQEQNKQQQQGEKQEQEKAAQQEQKEQQARAGEQKPEEQKQAQGQSAAAENKAGEEQEEAQAGTPQERQMTKEEAQQLLNSIEENRSKFTKKKAQEETAGQYRPEKDW